MRTEREKKKFAALIGLWQEILKKLEPLRNLLVKFHNDWAMNAAAALAYNLISASVPIVIALVAVFGLTIGALDAQATTELMTRIQHLFPANAAAKSLIGIAVTSLSERAGFLGLIAVLAAIFSGSRLFVSLDGYFAIVYRTAPRAFLPQNIMALLMMLAFLILIPLMVFASSLPALLPAIATIPVLDDIPFISQLLGNAFVLDLAGIVTGLVICWVLFETIYMVVPNMRMSFSKSWRGALVAACCLEVFLILFPFYITRFMGSYTGAAGFILILLIFFYYFAVILLMGAEMNASFLLGVPPLPANIAIVLRDTTASATPQEAQSDQQQP